MDYRRLVVLLFAFVAIALAASQSSSPANSDEKYQAVTAIRIINTAEAQYFGTAKRYGSLSELSASGALKQAESMFSVNDLPMTNGFVVRVVLSDDKKGYQIAATKDAQPFTVGFFSDERGPIYEGKPLQ